MIVSSLALCGDWFCKITIRLVKGETFQNPIVDFLKNNSKSSLRFLVSFSGFLAAILR